MQKYILLRKKDTITLIFCHCQLMGVYVTIMSCSCHDTNFAIINNTITLKLYWSTQMKTLAQTLLNTLIFICTISLSTNSLSQNEYYDTNIGQLTEGDGAQGNFYNSDNYEEDNTVYDNTIIQYADGSEYRSTRNNNNPYNNMNQPRGNNGYPQTQPNSRNNPNMQVPSDGSGLGDNLYKGNNPKQYPTPNNNPRINPDSQYDPKFNPNPSPIGSQGGFNNDELKDYGVQATRQLHSGSFHGPTPTSIPGGRVITTNQLQSMVMNGQNNTLIFDVLDGQQYLPGAIPASQGAAPGNFSDQTQQRMGQFLSQVTRSNKQMAMVFYCQNSYCWMSYNAALRAINMGYQNVYWYRGGIEAWQQQGLSVQYTNNNSPYNNY